MYINFNSRMKSFVLFCLVAIAGVALAKPGGHQGYTTKYDGIDIHQIVNNRRLLVGYINCVLDLGKCTNEGKELKSHIREALETHCAKCSETQVNATRTIIRHLINHEADYWNKLKAKYDPKGKFTQQYEKELRDVRS
uniref:Chemosensory protein 12 n=1 Tax=Heortia vitessoides TaxID=1557813 RepID=A0A978W7B8_9NEOP|nr:chemosensory protein 12 [Heortia vitessoides]